MAGVVVVWRVSFSRDDGIVCYISFSRNGSSIVWHISFSQWHPTVEGAALMRFFLKLLPLRESMVSGSLGEGGVDLCNALKNSGLFIYGEEKEEVLAVQGKVGAEAGVGEIKVSSLLAMNNSLSTIHPTDM
ncbi:hypothetical protein VNO80_30503 [Phaseolus coccineus]|uniref:Uncharacterized protein n=1 Tax=Phaseolus coccineus TaxID=3886 RepID=A0AAN9QG57_PHACN